MKKIIGLSKIILGTGLLIYSMNSCIPKHEDPKEVANEINEEKIENEDVNDDADYLTNVAEINLSEIEMGKLAIQKGVNAGVVKYGHMLVTDHTKSLEELKALANKKTISIPNSITDEGREKYNQLNKKSGADFDKKFVDMITQGHEKAVDKMTEISQKTTDMDIQIWASR